MMFSDQFSLKKEGVALKSVVNHLKKEKELPKDPKIPSSDHSKTPQDSTQLLNSIFAFNGQVGKGILLCLQNQMNFAQIFMDLIQGCETDQSYEYSSTKSTLQNDDKTLKPGQSFVQGSNVSLPVRKDLLTQISSKLEKMMGDLNTTLHPFQNNKTQHTNNFFSPPSSSRNWMQDIKRASVPLAIRDSENQAGFIVAEKLDQHSSHLIDRRASTDSLNILNGLKSPTSTTTTTTNPLIDSKNVKQFLKKKQASLNKNNICAKLTTKVSPRVDDLKEKAKFTLFQDDRRNSSSSHIFKDFSISREANVTSKSINRCPERERNVSEKNNAMKPSLGLIPRKELAEESLTDNNGDKTLNSSASSNLRTPTNETDRMSRIPDLDGNSLIMSLNQVQMAPIQEKKTIKEQLKEEPLELTLDQVRGNSKMPEKRNLISAKWWRSWKEYVNFDSEVDAGSVMIGIYQRPGRIVNRGLLKYDIIQDLGSLTGELELKDHLLEHHDYEVVSKKVFDTLAKWYGFDFEIARGVKADPFRNNKLYIDLYPNGEAKAKNMKFRTVSPPNNLGADKVISNIISTNLLNLQTKAKYDSKTSLQ